MDFAIEDVKRWQWALLGMIVGLLLAYAQNELGEDVPAGTLDSYTFVSQLRRTPYPNGNNPLPWVDRIVVIPKAGGKLWVRAQLLEFTDNRREMRYRTYVLTDWKGVPTSPWGGRRTAKGAPPSASKGQEVGIGAFLKDAAKQYPHVSYRYAWWASPRNRLLTYTAVGLVVVGGIWPTLLNLLTGAGFGRARQADPKYDLSRFKGEAARAKAPPAAESKDALAAHVLAMEEELLATLSKDVAARYEEPAPEPIRDLKRGGAVSEINGVVVPDEQEKEYKGQYYPVALTGAEKHGEHPKGKPQ